MPTITERNGRHLVRWRDQNGEHTKSRRTRKLAEKLSREVEEDLAVGRPWEPRVAREAPKLEAGMSAFILDRQRVLETSTCVRYARGLDLFRRFLDDVDAGVDVLTQRALVDFFAWLRLPETGLHGRQRSEDTARKQVEIVQLLWQWLANADEFIRDTPPPRTIEMRRSEPEPTVAPTWEEMDRAIAFAHTEWHRQLATLLRFTGVRVEQAMMIEWRHVDLDNATIVIATGKSAQEKRGRIVPISAHLATILAGWGVREGYVVKSGRSADRARQPRDRDMARVWTRSGVREAAWLGRPHHCFRKGFISGLKRAGADDEAVKALVGHSLGLRGRYVDADALGLRDVVAQVPPMSAGTTAVLQMRGGPA